MPYPWFKLYGSEYLSDAKILSLSAASRSCWLTLLCYASISSEPGVVRHVTEDLLMMQAGVDSMADEWGNTKGILKRFEKLDMVKLADDSITILNWEKRQDSYLNDAERASRYRTRHGKVTQESRDDVTEVTLDKNRTDKNREENTQSAKADAVNFGVFWSAYPRKVAKPMAQKAFSRALKNKTSLVDIMAGLEKWKKSSQWLNDDGKYIPHASTWLNGERWNDEVKAGVTKATDRF